MTNPTSPNVIYANTTDTTIQNLQDNIDHIIVIMFENRSFDHMLGKLYPAGPNFEGLPANASNSYKPLSGNPETIAAWTDPSIFNAPSGDPGTWFACFNEQIFGDDQNSYCTFQDPRVNTPGLKPSMAGFVQNYYSYSWPVFQSDDLLKQIMFYHTPDQLKVLSTLATNYALCDFYFSSAPTATYPNRIFLHTASSGCYGLGSYACADDVMLPTPYFDKTIFTQFQNSTDWCIYQSADISPSAALTDLWPYYKTNFQDVQNFYDAAAAGTLPKYSFIECDYFSDSTHPDAQHPPADVRYGEQFLAQVYNALQKQTKTDKWLLVITYDEAGGCYDHVPTPDATPPVPDTWPCDPVAKFRFDRFGMRVPTILVSPFIQPGTIFRVPASQDPTYQFDHTSILSTIIKCFGLPAPVTPAASPPAWPTQTPFASERLVKAPDFSAVIDPTAKNMGAPITPEPLPPVPADSSTPLSLLEMALMCTASVLPDLSQCKTDAEAQTAIQNHLAQLKQNQSVSAEKMVTLKTVAPPPDPAKARVMIHQKAEAFFGKKKK